MNEKIDEGEIKNNKNKEIKMFITSDSLVFLF